MTWEKNEQEVNWISNGFLNSSYYNCCIFARHLYVLNYMPHVCHKMSFIQFTEIVTVYINFKFHVDFVIDHQNDDQVDIHNNVFGGCILSRSKFQLLIFIKLLWKTPYVRYVIVISKMITALRQNLCFTEKIISTGRKM